MIEGYLFVIVVISSVVVTSMIFLAHIQDSKSHRFGLITAQLIALASEMKNREVFILRYGKAPSGSDKYLGELFLEIQNTSKT